MGGRLCDDSGTSLRFRIGIALAVVAFAGTASAASAPTIRLYGLVFPAHGNPEPMSLARLDPSTLAPVGQPTLLGQFIGFAVLSPDARRVAVVSATGTVRSVTLRFGAVRTTRLLAAALAVDAGSSRAYVVLSGGRVAVIDLRTLRVAYHVVHPLPHESTATDWVTFRAARFG